MLVLNPRSINNELIGYILFEVGYSFCLDEIKDNYISTFTRTGVGDVVITKYEEYESAQIVMKLPESKSLFILSNFYIGKGLSDLTFDEFILNAEHPVIKFLLTQTENSSPLDYRTYANKMFLQFEELAETSMDEDIKDLIPQVKLIYQEINDYFNTDFKYGDVDIPKNVFSLISK